MRGEIERRAHGRCEYCRAPQRITGVVFHLEHIVPRKRGGAGDLSNRALACPMCNLAKSSHVSGCDPLSGAFEPLFNPRQQIWAGHFCLAENRLAIRGLTPTGRATVARLQLNSRIRLLARLDWLAAEKWP